MWHSQLALGLRAFSGDGDAPIDCLPLVAPWRFVNPFNGEIEQTLQFGKHARQCSARTSESRATISAQNRRL